MTWFWLIPKPAISCIEIFLCVLAVFAQFGRFSRFCLFCKLRLVPLGTTNSQESLEIIIYIQTASLTNFSMWWRGFGWYQNLLSHALKNFCAFWPFLWLLADLSVLARFVHLPLICEIKINKNFSMHEIAGYGINRNPVNILKNFCD